MPPLLEARNVSKVYGSGPNPMVALDRFAMAIDGEQPVFTAVAGESGSGKTTLARLLLGFISPSQGEVLYRGKNLWTMGNRDWLQFRHEVQAIFQDPFEVFNPFYKVDHLLTVPIEKFRLASSKAERQKRMEEALHAVGLRPDETLGRYPHQLSGGQRQRLTVARALLLRPRLIIADEPVSMVDASLRATILENLRTLHRDFGISFLYITHDLTTAYQICENIVVLYRGSVAEIGDVDLVIRRPSHPYSQLLVSSIPEPDVESRWVDDDAPAQTGDAGEADGRGCSFAPRCPFAMPMCRETAPPLFRTHARRAAACYLYRDAPLLREEDLAGFLGSAGPSAGRG
jgi:peptide/nickel transport system ATP-binding protein